MTDDRPRFQIGDIVYLTSNQTKPMTIGQNINELGAYQCLYFNDDGELHREYIAPDALEKKK